LACPPSAPTPVSAFSATKSEIEIHTVFGINDCMAATAHHPYSVREAFSEHSLLRRYVENTIVCFGGELSGCRRAHLLRSNLVPRPSQIVHQVTVPYRYEHLSLKDVKHDCFSHGPDVLPDFVMGRIMGITIPAEALLPNSECVSPVSEGDSPPYHAAKGCVLCYALDLGNNHHLRGISPRPLRKLPGAYHGTVEWSGLTVPVSVRGCRRSLFAEELPLLRLVISRMSLVVLQHRWHVAFTIHTGEQISSRPFLTPRSRFSSKQECGQRP